MSGSTSPIISFEFFPAKTPEGMDKLESVASELAGLEPAFFSVTYGAGGTTKTGTQEAVSRISKATGIETAPHLSCVGETKAALTSLLDQYKADGIRRIVALRGDLPSGHGANLGELRYASQLVTFIRDTYGDHFKIEVAAYPEKHPQADNPDTDLRYFIEKCQAGADQAITQYFFNADSYFYFVDRVRKAGIDTPIIPGIMPITNYTRLTRFSDMCGAEIPRWIRERLKGYGDDMESLKAFGHEVVANMCQQLLKGGAPGLHFYTLNQAKATSDLVKAL